jgi:hypothetical protein
MRPKVNEPDSTSGHAGSGETYMYEVAFFPPGKKAWIIANTTQHPPSDGRWHVELADGDVLKQRWGGNYESAEAALSALQLQFNG